MAIKIALLNFETSNLNVHVWNGPFPASFSLFLSFPQTANNK